jgi:glyoxylase-like metal-dependent hydrolase (beta-lactamase superfamily II)
MFKQLFDPTTWTYTYLIADEQSKEAAFIDPVNTHLQLYLDLLKEHGLTLKYSFETHVHADHVTANTLMLEHFPKAQVSLYEKSPVKCKFLPLKDTDTLQIGNYHLKAFDTPGHTQDDMCYLFENLFLLPFFVISF